MYARETELLFLNLGLISEEFLVYKTVTQSVDLNLVAIVESGRSFFFVRCWG